MAGINGVASVWLTVSVPQGASQGLHPGAHAVSHLAAFPGEDFVGVVESILPAASAASRAVEVRVALPNPDGRLRPGMTGDVSLSGPEMPDALIVPSEAVIRSGSRTLVIAVGDNGRFVPTEVATGLAMGDQIQILTGLDEGQKIVASGQFLIDSEASLSGVVARLSAGGAARADYTSKGKVVQVGNDGVTIAHEPVAGLGWPAMTMSFAWGPGGKRPVAIGDAVAFSFKQGGAGYVIETITREGAAQ